MVKRRYFFCGSFMFLFCLVFAMFCARLFICALWSPAGKGLTSWLSFVVSTVSLSLSHWYPGSGVVLNCIDSCSLHPYLLSYWSPFLCPKNNSCMVFSWSIVSCVRMWQVVLGYIVPVAEVTIHKYFSDDKRGGSDMTWHGFYKYPLTQYWVMHLF